MVIMDKVLTTFDKSGFGDSSYVRRIEKPWGFEIHFTPEHLPYAGKILHIDAGKRLSLQLHDEKLESWYKLSGSVIMLLENEVGELTEVEMLDGYGYTVQVGRRHRLVAVDDSEILEVSTPELGNTYRLDDDYSRPTETQDLRSQPNRGWNSASAAGPQ
jgi:mannose-6-phosphate isomerase